MTIKHSCGVSKFLMRTVFTTWIIFLFHHFKDYRYIMFPEEEEFKDTLPKYFWKHPRLKCYETTANKKIFSYSSYKSHCTMKCLIAVNSNRIAWFISDLFEGNISDVDIYDQCGMLQQINPGDKYMLTKGSLYNIFYLQSKQQYLFYLPWGKGMHLQKK